MPKCFPVCEAAFATYLEAAQRFGKSPSAPLNHHHHHHHQQQQVSAKREGGQKNAPHVHARGEGGGEKMGGAELEGGDDEREEDDERWMTVPAGTTTEKACLHAKIKLGEILASCSTGAIDIEGHCYEELVAFLTTLQYIQQH